jgi:hypothetical protein
MQTPPVSGFLIREEPKEVLRALVEFSTTGNQEFSTVDAVNKDEEVDTMQVDEDGPLAPLENPFLDPAAALVSDMG